MIIIPTFIQLILADTRRPRWERLSRLWHQSAFMHRKQTALNASKTNRENKIQFFNKFPLFFLFNFSFSFLLSEEFESMFSIQGCALLIPGCLEVLDWTALSLGWEVAGYKGQGRWEKLLVSSGNSITVWLFPWFGQLLPWASLSTLIQDEQTSFPVCSWTLLCSR